MKIKALHIASVLSIIAATQLLFYWLVPIHSNVFAAIYPFYSLITIVHIALSTFIGIKYKYPSSSAPILSGSIVTFTEIVVALLLGLLCNSIRTILYSQAIILVIYILVMTLFVSITAKESVNRATPSTPIRPYVNNTNTPIQPTLPKRKPSSIDKH